MVKFKSKNKFKLSKVKLNWSLVSYETFKFSDPTEISLRKVDHQKRIKIQKLEELDFRVEIEQDARQFNRQIKIKFWGRSGRFCDEPVVLKLFFLVLNIWYFITRWLLYWFPTFG